LRQRNHRELIRPADPGEKRPDAQAFRDARHHGSGFALYIAAHMADRERQCVALVGDGGFSMLMADFVTAVKYQLPIKVVIIKNNTLGQIKWEQMAFLGAPEYGVELIASILPSLLSPWKGR
jgi:thiamine pyrophosphate-dependent acetolactate synthase large subunit-like protein